MEKYIIKRSFKDAENNEYIYEVDKNYPCDNFYPTEERIKFLLKKGYIRKLDISEWTYEDLVSKVIELGTVIDESNYSRESLIALIISQNKNNEDVIEKKEIQKELKKRKITFDKNLSLEELKKLLND